MAFQPSRGPRILERGVLCVVIGLVVLISPRFLQSSRWYDMVAGAYLVGWFALVLGAALIVLALVQRSKRPRS
ncbi:hypothetical protein [Variovorax ginsengisoli]|uniref:Uncharacterized membrane protein HdeD (DUF308 family) n=1 Tax=Variovorax ginsengisoli TaxID=363844 RepID=A0ABT9S4H2_9BURK|nr:hypothetical protein [Variovorax ginsengisoli]MDP9899247.1 uncharacterized membrane protein HdeD (DUF308 family) [Variovorax ginsengisoli]